MKYVLIGAFVVMVCAQWIVPLSMIKDANTTIEEGVEYRFMTEPVDPSDPFRGKYITLRYNVTTYHPADTNEFHLPMGSTVYAVLGRDSAGYAKINKLVPQPPPNNNNYITATYDYGYAGPDSYISLMFPFSTFYVEESKASEAEQLYWQSRGTDSLTCYAKVMVLKGDAKLVDVMINDSSIVDVVRRINKNKND